MSEGLQIRSSLNSHKNNSSNLVSLWQFQNGSRRSRRRSACASAEAAMAHTRRRMAGQEAQGAGK